MNSTSHSSSVHNVNCRDQGDDNSTKTKTKVAFNILQNQIKTNSLDSSVSQDSQNMQDNHNQLVHQDNANSFTYSLNSHVDVYRTGAKAVNLDGKPKDLHSCNPSAISSTKCVDTNPGLNSNQQGGRIHSSSLHSASITGLLRTKSGRSDLPKDKTTLSMSCSDKLARWNVTGIQGWFII
jgi:hypothetical protein